MPEPSESNWKSPDSFAPSGGVDVWLAFVSGADAGVLSLQERSRAERFFFERDRRSFVFHHSTLRHILSRYLGAAPECIPFQAGANGKPVLGRPYAAWRFSLSHSGEAGLYAVARGIEVGVDIERIREVSDMEGVARRFLSDAERARGDFFAAWTRKEALLKASGVGLGGLESAAPPGGWTVLELPPVPGYAAALAVEGPARPVSTWRWVR